MHSAALTGLTIGVEEEFHLVDLETRRLAARAPQLLDAVSDDAIVAELHRSVVETNSPVLTSLDELQRTLQAGRRRLAATARDIGVGVVAAGSVPLVDAADIAITTHPRYLRMLQEYQHLAREQLICGTHVHVGVEDRDLAVAVARRIGPDLPVFLALTASSPFWLGEDTGYASFRTSVWSRWPTAGPFPPVDSAEQYDGLVSDLIDTGVITDAGMLYFDVRPSAHVPTLELRLCDASPRVQDVVLVTALFRALVRQACEDALAGEPWVDYAAPLPTVARWSAARYGLEGDLVDLRRRRSEPAHIVVERLLARLRPQLEATGDWQTVRELVHDALLAGSAAARQRAAFRRSGRLADVVDLLLTETAGDERAAVVPAVPHPPGAILDGYRAPPGDEGVEASGLPRPLLQPALAALQGLGSEVLRVRELARDRFQADREVTFVVDGETLPFPIDLVPRAVPDGEWQRLVTGLRQRAVALEAFLRDVYSRRDVVEAGIVPRDLVENSPGLRPAGTLVPDGVVRAAVIGVDLVRDAEGRWLALEDNCRMPSGLGYAVHARNVLRTVLPELVPPSGTPDPGVAVERLGDALRSGLGRSLCRTVLLTTGPGDPTWWEHQTLAAKIGADLVRPRDLVVSEDGVERVEAGGRWRVDVVYRRFDEDLLDHVTGADGRPLGRRLLAAVQKGRVVLANAPGNGVADDKAVYAFVPRLIEHYLGQAPLLDSVPTYLCADPRQCREVLDRAGELVVKPVDGYGGSGVTIGPAASTSDLEALRRQIRLAPHRWIAQELVALSTHPTLVAGRLEPRHVDLRVFVVLRSTGAGLTDVAADVVPAPLTRVAPRGSLVVNSSRGAGGKDTWIVPSPPEPAGRTPADASQASIRVPEGRRGDSAP